MSNTSIKLRPFSELPAKLQANALAAWEDVGASDGYQYRTIGDDALTERIPPIENFGDDWGWSDPTGRDY